MENCCCEVEPLEVKSETLNDILRGIGKLLNEAHLILEEVEGTLLGQREDARGETPPPYSMLDYSRQLLDLALQVDIQAKHIKDAVGH